MKVLRDAGLVKYDEPFTNLLTQGMVIKDGAKMSKSLGNVVSPEEIISKYGADTARLFIMFAAPPERELEWSDQGVEGSFRFINRVWRIVSHFQGELAQKVTGYDTSKLDEADKELRRVLHNTIKKVNMKFHRYIHIKFFQNKINFINIFLCYNNINIFVFK